jgi:hypothetical protein
VSDQSAIRYRLKYAPIKARPGQPYRLVRTGADSPDMTLGRLSAEQLLVLQRDVDLLAGAAHAKAGAVEPVAATEPEKEAA